MKFVLLLFVVTISESLGVFKPSFLRYVGNYKYNETQKDYFTVKRYYLSQRVTHTWEDAYMNCRSIGMHLATIESKKELINLNKIARKHPKLFNEKVFVEAEKVAENFEPTACHSVMRSDKRKLEVKPADCQAEQKFLCDDFVEYWASQFDSAENEKIDVKSTFFSTLGTNGNEEKTNSRYFVSKNSAISVKDANLVCQSFDMILASPQSQDEFDGLQKLLRSFYIDWTHLTVAGFRSEINERDWVDEESSIKYEIDWLPGEPKNENGENCIAFSNSKDGPKMCGISCLSKINFICEFDPLARFQQTSDHSNLERFMKPLTQFFETTRRELYIGLSELDWIKAKLACQNFGMELLTPDSKVDDIAMREALLKLNITILAHIGASSLGLEGEFYAIHSGKVFDFDIQLVKTDRNLIDSANCLQLKTSKDSKNLIYEKVPCFNHKIAYICQKTTKPTNEELLNPKAEKLFYYY